MSENQIDFELLLKKYIHLIGEIEGTDFIGSQRPKYDGEWEFTEEEWAELNRLSKEVD